NGLPSEDAKTEFYQHDSHWANRMILGDSLAVMASLAEREGLRGKVQCIYFDPPYGIKFNSNFQWSTASRDVKDGSVNHITREPEQVKAFRDTWKDGIHSYLTYLRDRLTAARDLLTQSGSIFLQIGDENVHRVRTLLDEVFGAENLCAEIVVQKTSSASGPAAVNDVLPSVADYILWYAKDRSAVKFRQPYFRKDQTDEKSAYVWVQESDGSRRRMSLPEAEGQIALPAGARLFRQSDLTSQTGVDKTRYPVNIEGREFRPNVGVWKTGETGMARLLKADRVIPLRTTLAYQRYFDDFAVSARMNLWTDTSSSVGADKVYVVQTHPKIIERCILMATDPGDLVIDPTCGSGTSAYVAEQWGRRWITIDTSRVALALARSRIMGARYPYYLLSDSRDGQIKEAELKRCAPSSSPTHGNVQRGFVLERVPHITLKSIANNTEIDVIYDKHQALLEPLRAQLNQALGKAWPEWDIPREADAKWPEATKKLHAQWWAQRIARQKEIDASIAAKAEFEFLYDKPYEDKKKVRVAGPFTVESLSPHRVLSLDEDDELVDGVAEQEARYRAEERDFATIILDQLRMAGVQQAHKE
ncbi:MAG TPA: DNA methyltransferase, partial [Pseudomonadota bacterium]|nr:DNA methyltransferase [Pseudomonadota bacterium]